MDFMDALGYLMRIIPFVVFLLFFVISIISWLFFCCCCCCPCCCCKQKKKETCCKTCSFVSALTMLSAVLGISLYCLITLQSFFGGFNGFACSFMKLLNEIIHGQEIKKVPKWNGITGITNILDNSVGAVKSIQRDVTVAFKGNEWIKDAPVNFKANLTDEYNTISTSRIDQKDPPSATATPITPIYVSTFGPYTTASTTLFAINKDFETRIVEGSKILEEGQTAAESLSKNDDAINSINDIASTIKGFEGTFSSLETDIVNPMENVLDLMNEYGDLVLFIMFCVMSGLSLLSIIFLNIYALCKQNWAKCFLVLIWNLFTIIMIALFLISSIFGIVGVVGIDAVGVANEIISKTNLESTEPLIIPLDISKYINICLNGDGDISKEFNLSQASLIDDLNKMKVQIDEVKKNISENQNSIAIKEINKTYDDIIHNFLTATMGTGYTKTFASQLEELNALTMGKTNFDDMWVSEKSLCKNPKYTFRIYDPNAPKASCFVIGQWTPPATRYHNDATIEAYLDTLKSYDVEHIKIINNLMKSVTTIDKEFAKIASQMLGSINRINQYILDPLTGVFDEFVGDDNVFSIVNCKFMAKHISVFLDQLQAALGMNFFNYAILFGSMSFCLFFGVIFLLIAVNRCKFVKPKKVNNAIIEQNSAPGMQIDSEIINIKKQ